MPRVEAKHVSPAKLPVLMQPHRMDQHWQVTIAVYVLASIVLVLSIIVGILVYKLKHYTYKVIESSVSVNIEKAVNEKIKKEYSPQISLEPQAPHEMNFDTLKKKTEEAKTLLIVDDKENTQRYTSNTPAKTPPFTTAQLNITQELKSHLMKARQVKLERDEIHKICESELTKSQTPINITKNAPPEKSSLMNSVTEKSASMPQLLEIDEYYDELPSNKRPVGQTGHIVDEFYDLLPSTKNVIVKDEDTDYLVIVSDQTVVEPSYINAKIAL